jgi:hypothetical protein
VDPLYEQDTHSFLVHEQEVPVAESGHFLYVHVTVDPVNEVQLAAEFGASVHVLLNCEATVRHSVRVVPIVI